MSDGAAWYAYHLEKLEKEKDMLKHKECDVVLKNLEAENARLHALHDAKERNTPAKSCNKDAEIARLRQRLNEALARGDHLQHQLDKLKPKPVLDVWNVKVCVIEGDRSRHINIASWSEGNNLKLTFETGKLVAAEVLNAK